MKGDRITPRTDQPPSSRSRRSRRHHQPPPPPTTKIRTAVHRLLQAVLEFQTLVFPVDRLPELDDLVPHEPVAVGIDTHTAVLLGGDVFRLCVQLVHGKTEPSRAPGRHEPATDVVRALGQGNNRRRLPLLLELLHQTVRHVHPRGAAANDHQIVHLVFARRIVPRRRHVEGVARVVEHRDGSLGQLDRGRTVPVHRVRGEADVIDVLFLRHGRTQRGDSAQRLHQHSSLHHDVDDDRKYFTYGSSV